jgi:hypothetical protein
MRKHFAIVLRQFDVTEVITMQGKDLRDACIREHKKSEMLRESFGSGTKVYEWIKFMVADESATVLVSDSEITSVFTK